MKECIDKESHEIVIPYWLPERFIVVDLETTGLCPVTNEIIEIAAIKFCSDETTHVTFQSLVRPKSSLPKFIAKLTGITQSMVEKDGAAIEQILPQFKQCVENLPLVAFNASFDISFLQIAAGRQGWHFPNEVICALRAARKAWPGRKSYRLASLSEDVGLDTTERHRALPDCKRSLFIYSMALQCLAPRLDLSFTKLTPSDRLPFDYPKLEFEGKHFSFVGKFFSGSKIFFYQLVVRKNGIPANFSKKTDYLVVGADVGADWIVSAAGRRILNVLNMKEAGSPIQIINEYHLLAHV
jgi:DNA polymerase III subunit epsilon